MDSYVYFSPLGTLEVYLDGESLVGVEFKDDRNSAAKKKLTGAVKLWLDDYFSGKKPSIKSLKLRLCGTEFQGRVWEMLTDIPYGTVVSYGEVARRLESKYGYEKMSPRAVGGAVHANPIAIVVPCHRVVGTKGNLVGYAYGTDKKQALIEFEKKTK